MDIIGNYPYIIAEIGSNHNGDMRLAKKMISVAAEIGCDAVKFQSWTKKSLFSKMVKVDPEVEKCVLMPKDHIVLKRHCDKKGITFCSSAFSREEVDMLDDLGVPFFKIASMDLNYLDFIEYVARKKKPIFLSTGMGSAVEILSALREIYEAGNPDVALLHCVSLYPPDDGGVNLKNIQMLKDMFNHPVGFSDHTIGISIPLAAVAMGAVVIEKHFTIDNALPGADNAMSANVDEMRQIVKGSKRIINAQGVYDRDLSVKEYWQRDVFRRSAVATKKLKKGHTLVRDDIDFKRPGIGISPNDLDELVGSEACRDIEDGGLIRWGDLVY